MKQDPKEVASQQKSEMDYICRVFKNDYDEYLSKDVLRMVMKRLGSNGKLCRSRRNIYVALRGKLNVWVSGYRQIRGRDTTFVALATNGDCLLNAIRSCLAFPPCSTLCGGGGGVAWLACIQAWQFACFFK